MTVFHDYKTNTLKIIFDNKLHRNKNKFTDSKSKKITCLTDLVNELYIEDDCVGIEIPNYYTDNLKYIGKYAEALFEEFCLDNGIMALDFRGNYSGQKFRKTVKKEMGAKRPDFLIQIKNKCDVLVDVKSFKDASDGFVFTMGSMRSYLNTIEHFNTPLIFAFFDHLEYENSGLKTFYMISFEKIKKFIDSVICGATEEFKEDVYEFIIPRGICTAVSDTFDYDINENYNIDDKFIIKEIFRVIKKIKDVDKAIKDMVKNEPKFKTKYKFKDCKKYIDSIYFREYENRFKRLIEFGDIIFKRCHPLTLKAEVEYMF